MATYNVTPHHDGTRWRWTIEELPGASGSRPLITFNSHQDAIDTMATLLGVGFVSASIEGITKP